VFLKLMAKLGIEYTLSEGDEVKILSFTGGGWLR